MRQAQNNVKIEGILSETNLNYSSFNKDGRVVDAIGGTIRVLVPLETSTLDIPVFMFSTKYIEKGQKKGSINPAYESIENVMKTMTSIAAAGGMEGADKIRISGAKIRMNEFYNQNGQLVSQPRVYASFVNKATNNFKPSATFEMEFMVSNIKHAVNYMGEELDPVKLEVTAIVPQYTSPTSPAPEVDVIPLVVTNPKAINAIETYWEKYKTYKANGRINFTSTTEQYTEEVDFGEAPVKVRTINVNELIITAGSQSPLEDEFAFDVNDISAGMNYRKEKLEKSKTSRLSAKRTPAAGKEMPDLGF